MKALKSGIIVAVLAASIMSGCTAYNGSIREPNSRIEFKRDDFVFSEQVSGTARSIKVLGIDWGRLFVSRAYQVEGKNLDIPVIGGFVQDQTDSYALNELITANPNYDVVFYPQFERNVFKPIFGIGLFTKISTVKVKARLAKIK